MGDFNMNLFDSSSSDAFQSSLYEHNMIPTISLATNEVPGCTPSLIDNILTSSTENLVYSGLLDYKVSSHIPVFAVFDFEPRPSNESDIKTPKYDYCKSNMDKLLS